MIMMMDDAPCNDEDDADDDDDDDDDEDVHDDNASWTYKLSHANGN